MIAERYELSLAGVEQWLARTTYATTTDIKRSELDLVADTLLDLGLVTPAQRAKPFLASLR